MTRIVSGRWGGRRLQAPKGPATRPTSDRVREAVFSRLESWGVLEAATVLDLYAGTGALGIEAVSRGARRAVLVESDRGTAQVIRRNVESLDARSLLEVRQAKAETLLRGDPSQRFDLVFLDPPYPVSESDLATVLNLLTSGWLTQGATVVVERSSRSPEPTWPDGLELVAARTYGETAIYLAEVPAEEA